MQVRQIFRWQQVATFGYENSEMESRVGCAVFVVSVHQNIAWPFSWDILHAVCIPNIADCGSERAISLLRLMSGIFTHMSLAHFYSKLTFRMLQHLKNVVIDFSYADSLWSMLNCLQVRSPQHLCITSKYLINFCLLLACHLDFISYGVKWGIENNLNADPKDVETAFTCSKCGFVLHSHNHVCLYLEYSKVIS